MRLIYKERNSEERKREKKREKKRAVCVFFYVYYFLNYIMYEAFFMIQTRLKLYILKVYTGGGVLL